MQLHLLPLATGLEVGLFFGIAGMAVGVIFGLFGMYFAHRRRVLWHETARVALEKGLPIPGPAPENGGWSALVGGSSPEQQHLQRIRGSIVGGLINLAVGFGMFIAFQHMPGVPPHIAYFGAIPGFIGVALLLGALLEHLFFRGPDNRGTPPSGL